MWNSSWPKSAGKYNCIQRISHLTCKTYSLKALINFFCWHPIFWRRSSLIESHGTELFFFVCGRLSQFRTDFHRSIYILSRTATYLHFFDLLNICALEYLCSFFFSVINIACVLLIFLCAVKLFVLRRFAFANCIIIFTSHHEHISHKTFFFKSSLFQTQDSAVFEEVSKNSSTNSQKVY